MRRDNCAMYHVGCVGCLSREEFDETNNKHDCVGNTSGCVGEQPE